MAIRYWMLLPSERIGGDSIQVMAICGAKRPECDEFALQNRLIIE